MKVLTILLIFALTPVLYSADTTETFDLGFSDYEYYYGLSNLRDDKKVFSQELTIGLGISSSLASTLTFGSEKFDGKADSFYAFGLFFNTFESKHFDFDLYANMDNSFELSLGFELNLDLKDELALAGIYMRGELAITEEIDAYSLSLGTYYAAFKNVQILMEFDLNMPIEGDLEIGCLSLGFNYVFSDRFEFITDFNIDIPQDEEEVNLGFTIGFISTL